MPAFAENPTQESMTCMLNAWLPMCIYYTHSTWESRKYPNLNKTLPAFCMPSHDLTFWPRANGIRARWHNLAENKEEYTPKYAYFPQKNHSHNPWHLHTQIILHPAWQYPDSVGLRLHSPAAVLNNPSFPQHCDCIKFRVEILDAISQMIMVKAESF